MTAFWSDRGSDLSSRKISSDEAVLFRGQLQLEIVQEAKFRIEGRVRRITLDQRITVIYITLPNAYRNTCSDVFIGLLKILSRQKTISNLMYEERYWKKQPPMAGIFYHDIPRAGLVLSTISTCPTTRPNYKQTLVWPKNGAQVIREMQLRKLQKRIMVRVPSKESMWARQASRQAGREWWSRDVPICWWNVACSKNCLEPPFPRA